MVTTANIAAQSTQIAEVFVQGNTLIKNFGDIMKKLPGHVSFTGPVDVSAPEQNIDGTLKLYNGKKKHWLSPISGARPDAIDYQTGLPIEGAASIEVYVPQNLDLAEGIHAGYFIKSRHGNVPAFDYISDSDAAKVIELVNGSIMYTPLINRQESNIEYAKARDSRRTAQLVDRAAKGDTKAAAYLHAEGEAKPEVKGLGAKLLSMFTA